jgi:hypothetical protein
VDDETITTTAVIGTVIRAVDGGHCNSVGDEGQTMLLYCCFRHFKRTGYRIWKVEVWLWPSIATTIVSIERMAFNVELRVKAETATLSNSMIGGDVYYY